MCWNILHQALNLLYVQITDQTITIHKQNNVHFNISCELHLKRGTFSCEIQSKLSSYELYVKLM